MLGHMTYILAQLNIARMLEPLDSPVMADFVNALERINALAEASEGFIWRLIGEGDDATSLRPFDDDRVIVNMSSWQSIADLKNYVYKTAHAEFLKRRLEWFERVRDAMVVLWWIPQGHTPTVAEAKERLEHLRLHGPTEYAFTLPKTFEAPEVQSTP